jgi:magnesium chelatase subunit D
VGRDGAGGRPGAESDALDAARRLRGLGCAVLVVDTSPRGEPFARRVAAEMGARYEPLPYPQPNQVSGLARSLAGAVHDVGRG